MIGNDKTKSQWESWLSEAIYELAAEMQSEGMGDLEAYDFSGDEMWAMLVDRGCDKAIAKEIVEGSHAKNVTMFPEKPRRAPKKKSARRRS